MPTNIKHIINNALINPGFRRYFANTSWMFAEQVLRMLTGLLVGIWVARYLGPAQFGVFSYAIAFASLFGSIAKLGLDGIVVRDLVREPGNRNRYLGTAFWLKLVGALLMLGAVALATQLTSSDRSENLYIIIIASGAIPMTFMGNWLVTLLYGNAYKESGPALVISIWAGVFVFYGCARGQWLLAENMQKYGLICTSVGAITNIGLNYVLLGRIGIIGAAIATVLSKAVPVIVIPLFFHKDRISVLMFFKTFLVID